MCLNVKSSERSQTSIHQVFFCILSPLRILKILPNNINHSLSKVVNEFKFDEVYENEWNFNS
jgi:hypothetical protein